MLNQLVGYASSKKLQSEPGFAPKSVRWAVRYPGGDVVELGDAEAKRNPGRRFPKCPELSQPEIKRGGAGCRHFLVDSADVVALLAKNPQDPKLLAKHRYFVGLLRKASTALPRLADVAEWLSAADTVESIRSQLEEQKAKPTDKVTFRIDGGFPVESDRWHDWWRRFRQGLGEKESAGKKASAGPVQMVDLIDGSLVAPTPTHPKVAGLADVGGLAMGDVLISFKQDSFQSYGLEQSANAAVSESTAHAYRAALDALLKKSRRLVDARVAHWYAGQVSDQEDPIRMVDQGLDFLDENDAGQERREKEAMARARRLLESLSSGERADLAENRYYALTLSGASGRIMVRDWMEGQFKDLAAAINLWFSDLEIVRRDGQGLAKWPKFLAVLGGLARELKEVPPPLAAKLWRTALRNEPIPSSAASMALRRVRIDALNDDPPRHARLGLLKAFIIRNPNRKGDHSMGTHLNPDHPDPAYHCGRLLAVYADLQRSALGDVGAGVVQRYYTAASTTPALVLGRLSALSQHHLDKVSKDKGGLARWFESRVAEIFASMGDSIPSTLGLEEQSLFALGYYQEKAARRSKSKDDDSPSETAPEES